MRSNLPDVSTTKSYCDESPQGLLTLGDPDGHGDWIETPDDTVEQMRQMLAEPAERQARDAKIALGIGAAGLAVYGGVEIAGSVLLRNLFAVAMVTAPKWEPIVVDAIDGYVNPVAGGRLTIAAGQTKLGAEEISTGVRL